MDGNDNIGQLAEARPRKRQRGNGASDSSMQLDPNLQPQAAPQNIAMAPIQPQLQDYSPSIRQQQPLQHEYQPEMRQQGQPESSDYPRRRAMIAVSGLIAYLSRLLIRVVRDLQRQEDKV